MNQAILICNDYENRANPNGFLQVNTHQSDTNSATRNMNDDEPQRRTFNLY